MQAVVLHSSSLPFLSAIILYSLYPFGSWLNTPHMCLIRRFYGEGSVGAFSLAPAIVQRRRAFTMEGKEVEARAMEKMRQRGL